MRNIAAEALDEPSAAPKNRTEHPTSQVKPTELAEWLLEKGPAIAGRWLRELESRYDGPTGGVNGLREDFVTTLVGFLPGLLGPYRGQVEGVWIRAAELFGAAAARRGLAAGEVIDELQILREVIIRFLHEEPPLGGRADLSLRDILRLNRIIDLGVTHASVGHTDALFFSLFEGSGIPDAPPSAELKTEVRSQLRSLEEEVREVVGLSLGSNDDEVRSEEH
jgi:hypothetical protein